MKNLTVTVPEAVIDRLRLLAAARKQSVNRFVGDVLREVTREPSEDWDAAHAALFDQIRGLRSEGPWTREEIHARRIS